VIGGNFDQAILDFVAPTDGIYLLRLTSPVADEYAIVVTNSATFDVEPNDDSVADPTRSLDPTGGALGFVSVDAAVTSEPDDFPGGSILDGATPGAVLSDNVTGGSVWARDADSFDAPTGTRVFGSQFFGASGWREGDAEFRADFASPARSVSIDAGSDDSSDVTVLRAFAADGTILDEVISSSVGSGGWETLTITRSYADISYIIAAGVGNDISPLDNLRVTTGDATDSYTMSLTAGETVTIWTETPFDDSSGEPHNDLDPQLTIIDPNGNATVVPGSDKNAQITFTAPVEGTYVVSVGVESGSGEYVLRVSTGNAAPIAYDDSVTVEDGQSATIDVLANDVDIDGDVLSVSGFTQPGNGTLLANADGTFTYTPDAGFIGTDSFTYTACDGMADSDEATVTMTVGPPSFDLRVRLEASQTMGGSALSGPIDFVVDPTFFVNVYVEDLRANPTGVVGGAIDVTWADDLVTVDPSLLFGGDFTLFLQGVVDNTFDIIDEAGGLTTTLGVGAGVESLFFAIEVTADSVGEVTFSADPGEGTAIISPPNFAFAGSAAPVDWIDVEFEDATVEIAILNHPPTAADDDYEGTEDATLLISASKGLLANDSDIDGDPLSVTLISGPSYGSLNLNADGSFDYTPIADFDKTDSFTYRVNDGTANSDVATVTIDVKPQNDKPIANGDIATSDEDGTATIDVLGNDVDVDGDPLTITITGTANGAAIVNDGGTPTDPSDDRIEFTPDADFHGTTTVTYTVNDGLVDSNEATVQITVQSVNDAPVNVVPPSQRIVEDMVLALSVANGNQIVISDVDSGNNNVEVSLTVNQGTLTLSTVNGLTVTGNGTAAVTATGPIDAMNAALDGLTYKPDTGFVGNDLLTITTNDLGNTGSGGPHSDTSTVDIAVEPILIDLTVTISGTPFGDDAGSAWAGSTFWVNVYVEDLRDVPEGVVGGVLDLLFQTIPLKPTGNVEYGSEFSILQQGIAYDAAGMIEETGALTGQPGVGVAAPTPFVSWQFRRDGSGAPNDVNAEVLFDTDPGEGTAMISPANFALVGFADPVPWDQVIQGQVDVSLILGDFDHNQVVNQFDLALFVPRLFTSPGDGNYDPEFDLTGDGPVDQFDLAILLSRLYQPVWASESMGGSGSSGATSDCGIWSICETTVRGAECIDPSQIVAEAESSHPWQNNRSPEDVNGDGSVTARDVEIVINEINARGASDLPVAAEQTPQVFLDVSGDNRLTPLDVLQLVNRLNTEDNGEAEPTPAGDQSSEVIVGLVPTDPIPNDLGLVSWACWPGVPAYEWSIEPNASRFGLMASSRLSSDRPTGERGVSRCNMDLTDSCDDSQRPVASTRDDYIGSLTDDLSIWSKDFDLVLSEIAEDVRDVWD